MRVSPSSACTSCDICSLCCSMTPTDSRKSSRVYALRFARSHSARMTVMGVRSSCEASDVNCRSVSKAFSSRANIRSNAALSRRISRGPRCIFSRALRSSPAEMPSTAVRIFSIGRMADHAMSQPPPMVMASRMGSSVAVRTVIVCITPDRSSEEMMPRTQRPVTSMST